MGNFSKFNVIDIQIFILVSKMLYNTQKNKELLQNDVERYHLSEEKYHVLCHFQVETARTNCFDKRITGNAVGRSLKNDMMSHWTASRGSNLFVAASDRPTETIEQSKSSRNGRSGMIFGLIRWVSRKNSRLR